MSSNLESLSRIELLRLRQNHEFRRANCERRATHWLRLTIAAQALSADLVTEDATTSKYFVEVVVRASGKRRELVAEIAALNAQIATINGLLTPGTALQNWRDARDEFEALYGIGDEHA